MLASEIRLKTQIRVYTDAGLCIADPILVWACNQLLPQAYQVVNPGRESGWLDRNPAIWTYCPAVDRGIEATAGQTLEQLTCT